MVVEEMVTDVGLPPLQNRNLFLDQKAWQRVVWLVWLVPVHLFLDQEKTRLMMVVALVVVMAAWWVVLLFLQFSPVPSPVFVGLFAEVEMTVFF